MDKNFNANTMNLYIHSIRRIYGVNYADDILKQLRNIIERKRNHKSQEILSLLAIIHSKFVKVHLNNINLSINILEIE